MAADQCWSGMSVQGVGKLHFIEGTMDHKIYIDILKENLNHSSEMLRLEENLVFQ